MEKGISVSRPHIFWEELAEHVSIKKASSKDTPDDPCSCEICRLARWNIKEKNEGSIYKTKRKFGQENLNQSKAKPSTLFRATGEGSRPPPTISTTVSLEGSQSTSVEEAFDFSSTTLEDGEFNQDFDNFDIADDADDNMAPKLCKYCKEPYKASKYMYSTFFLQYAPFSNTTGIFLYFIHKKKYVAYQTISDFSPKKGRRS